MIEIGEKSSSLMEVFLYLSRYYENHNKIKSKVVNALFYPMILLFLAIIIVFVMSLFVLPMYEGIFRENIQRRLHFVEHHHFLVGVLLRSYV
jgi:type IV pilus assembly protein PilC